ncbi:retrotransposon protein, putative, ty1-copia subclass [Tanacetum coccineum]
MMNLITLPLSFWDYALESDTHILNMVPTKKVDKTPYELWIPKGNDGLLFLLPTSKKIVVARYVEFFEKKLISQEVSGRVVELKEIQDEDASPSENTSEIPMEVEGFKPPQEEVIPVCRSARTHRAPNRLCLNVEVKEHNLGDLNEPTNYKAAMLDPEFDKWLDAMNAEMQSMKDNQVWCLVDLPFNAIRILIAIAAFYDYEIWKMDVKTAFLNGYLDEDIYMVQPEGEATFILGIKIYRDRSNRLIGLIQSAYMDKILKRYRMDNSKRGNIPIQERLDLNKTQGSTIPKETDRDDIKSQTGYVFVLNEGAVNWKSSNQSTTTMSTTEAEYIVASEAVMEVV